jgi:glycosyltransferase
MEPSAVLVRPKTEVDNTGNEGTPAYIFKSRKRPGLKVSIITVTFNSGATVADTLESVRCQNYDNIEHIIVDGHSQDETMEIVRSFPHVKKWISEKDGGIYDAMNKGIQMATGDIIGILNSDDVYANSQVISKIAACFQKKSTETVYSDLNYVKAEDLEKVVRHWKSGDFKRENFYYGWMPPHPTFFVRREVYEKAGFFNLSLKSSADYELMLRILFKHQFGTTYLPEVLVKMRSGGASNSSFKNRILANQEDRKAWKLNQLHPYFFTLYLKPLRKIMQFF